MDTKNLIIRKACFTDRLGIQKVHKNSIQKLCSNYYDEKIINKWIDSDHFSSEKFESLLNNETVFVAENKITEDIIGFIQVEIRDNIECFNDYRRQVEIRDNIECFNDYRRQVEIRDNIECFNDYRRQVEIRDNIECFDDYRRQVEIKIDTKNKSGYVDRLYVDPNFIGNNIGSLLLKTVIEFCKKKSVKSINIDSTLNATKFYLKQGFKQGTNKKWYFYNSDIYLDCVSMLLKL
jgi:GNAT superfamily N-acetyltransferase